MSEDKSAKGFAKADLPSSEPAKGAKLKDRNDRDVSIGSTVEIPYHKGEEGKVVYIDEATGMVYVKMPAPILKGPSKRVTCKSKCGRAPKSAAVENGGKKGTLETKLAKAFEEIRELKKSLAANGSKTRKASKVNESKKPEKSRKSKKEEEETDEEEETAKKSKKSKKVEEETDEEEAKKAKKAKKSKKVEEEEEEEEENE